MSSVLKQKRAKDIRGDELSADKIEEAFDEERKRLEEVNKKVKFKLKEWNFNRRSSLGLISKEDEEEC